MALSMLKLAPAVVIEYDNSALLPKSQSVAVTGRYTKIEKYKNCNQENSAYAYILVGFCLMNSKQILTAQEDGGGNYHSQGAVHTGPSITTPGEGGGGG